MTSEPVQRVLWGIGTPRTMRAHWGLQELSLPYRTEVIRARSPEAQTPEFGALNPRRKVPVLQDGDFVITESAAIVIEMTRSFLTPLLPTLLSRSHT